MSLEQKDLELIERIIYKNADDIAISISRSFERLEERIDSAEARIFAYLSDMNDKIESGRQDFADMIGEVRDDVRDLGEEE